MDAFDCEAVDAFYDRHGQWMMGVASALTVDRAEAEDLVQDAMMRVIRHWKRVQRADNHRGYLRVLLVNQHLSTKEKQSRNRSLLERAGRAEASRDNLDMAAELESADMVRYLLRSLTGKQRAAVVLRLVEDCNYAEIASILRCRPATARAYVNRGLQAMRASGDALRTRSGRVEEAYGE